MYFQNKILIIDTWNIIFSEHNVNKNIKFTKKNILDLKTFINKYSNKELYN